MHNCTETLLFRSEYLAYNNHRKHGHSNQIYRVFRLFQQQTKTIMSLLLMSLGRAIDSTAFRNILHGNNTNIDYYRQ